MKKVKIDVNKKLDEEIEVHETQKPQETELSAARETDQIPQLTKRGLLPSKK